MDSCGSTLHRPVAARRRNARPGSSGSASSARYQGGVPQAALWSWDRHGQTPDPVLARLGSSSCLTCLIIRLIIQTIRQDPSVSVWIDGPSNLSRADRSGSDQIDAEHKATDLAVGVRIPRGAPQAPVSGDEAREAEAERFWQCQSLSAKQHVTARLAVTSNQPMFALRSWSRSGGWASGARTDRQPLL